MKIVKCRNCNAIELMCRCGNNDIVKIPIDDIHLFLDYYVNQYEQFAELNAFTITKEYFMGVTQV